MTLREWLNRILRRRGYTLERFVPSHHLEWHERHLLTPRRAAGEPLVLLDVGANRGQSIRRFRKHYPDAAIYSVEPFAPAVERLRRRYGEDPHLTVIQKAVADEPGTAPFHVNRSDQTNSLLASDGDGRAYHRDLADTLEVIDVEVTTLDAILAEHHLPRADLVKLDVQGAELRALRGAAEALRERRLGVVTAEVLMAPLYENQASFFELHAYMSGHGYQWCGLFNQSIAEDGSLVFGDAVWAAPRGG